MASHIAHPGAIPVCTWALVFWVLDAGVHCLFKASAWLSCPLLTVGWVLKSPAMLWRYPTLSNSYASASLMFSISVLTQVTATFHLYTLHFLLLRFQNHYLACASLHHSPALWAKYQPCKLSLSIWLWLEEDTQLYWPDWLQWPWTSSECSAQVSMLSVSQSVNFLWKKVVFLFKQFMPLLTLLRK